MKKVKGSKCLSKASRSDKQQVLQQLSKQLQVTKKILEKGDRDEAKELVQLSQKAESKASSSKG